MNCAHPNRLSLPAPVQDTVLIRRNGHITVVRSHGQKLGAMLPAEVCEGITNGQEVVWNGFRKIAEPLEYLPRPHGVIYVGSPDECPFVGGVCRPSWVIANKFGEYMARSEYENLRGKLAGKKRCIWDLTVARLLRLTEVVA